MYNNMDMPQYKTHDMECVCISVFCYLPIFPLTDAGNRSIYVYKSYIIGERATKLSIFLNVYKPIKFYEIIQRFRALLRRDRTILRIQ